MMNKELQLTPEIQKILDENGYAMGREVPNRGVCALIKMAYTTGLVWGIGEYDYRGRWCYSHPIHAIHALLTWNGIGDPDGDWIKYKGEGGERSNISEDDEEKLNMA